MEISRRLALLIDADNAQAALIPQIIEEAKKQGVLTIRRVYGDWTTPQLGSWKEVLRTYALQPIQQFSNVSGKNATDSALIIDAMDILYTVEIGGVCLVSSDSDYTRLANRIREKNLFVMGIGRSTTPIAFVNACDTFIFIESLQPPAEAAKKKITPPKSTTKKKAAPAESAPVAKSATATATTATATATAAKPASPANPVTPTTPASQPKKKTTPPAKLKRLLQAAFDACAKENGWAHLGAMGNALQQLDPDFDPRTYGHKLLSQLVEEYPAVIEVKRAGKDGGVIYIRLKGGSQTTK